MGFKFNPLTGKFDLVGSEGNGGSTEIISKTVDDDYSITNENFILIDTEKDITIKLPNAPNGTSITFKAVDIQGFTVEIIPYAMENIESETSYEIEDNFEAKTLIKIDGDWWVV